MKKKTLTSRFFKATVFIMVAVFTTLAFAGCEKEERSSVESSENTSVTESTIQEESVQESETQEISIPESTIQESSTQKSIIEVSWEESEESSENNSEEESQISQAEWELLTTEEAMKKLPMYAIDDGEKFNNAEKKDIVLYGRFINEDLSISINVGDIVGIIGRGDEDDIVFVYLGKGKVWYSPIENFEYLKDYEGPIVER